MQSIRSLADDIRRSVPLHWSITEVNALQQSDASYEFHDHELCITIEFLQHAELKSFDQLGMIEFHPCACF